MRQVDIQRIAEHMHNYSQAYYDKGLGRLFNLELVVRGLEAIAGEAAFTCSFAFEHFFRTAFCAGLTPEAIVSLYNGKNALNRFRQSNGYKTGEYIKEWRRSDEDPKGMEDNDILYLVALNGDVPKSIEQITEELAVVYADVKAFHAKGY
ncbi:hypothetical protein D3C86_568240 [compost metagenome]